MATNEKFLQITLKLTDNLQLNTDYLKHSLFVFYIGLLLLCMKLSFRLVVGDRAY